MPSNYRSMIMSSNLSPLSSKRSLKRFIDSIESEDEDCNNEEEMNVDCIVHDQTNIGHVSQFFCFINEIFN